MSGLVRSGQARSDRSGLVRSGQVRSDRSSQVKLNFVRPRQWKSMTKSLLYLRSAGGQFQIKEWESQRKK